ncbi:MAG: molybdopterin-dependent oxidoreductase [Candidatus Marinimicrobia bacterium]|nr:molybdopterin-dependent oxidoreductase [Candidatus Neomarinimicrobiota bacterium]
MPLLKIDEHELQVAAGTNVLAAALEAGLEIPYYCYHPALSVVGSCRMCMVEIEGLPKLQTSCSTPVGELPEEKKIDGRFDMVVHTKTEKALAARKLVLEFLLINHPLDCPVCDQAGECFLQDYAFKHGSAVSRFVEDKRIRAGTELGAGVVINYNRCIMCTRCVRFTREVTGTDELYVEERGNTSRIAVFDDAPLSNLLAGNVADICPVGALLLKDYMHTTRVWHLSNTPTVCTECTSGCSMTVDAAGDRIHRIVSRENEQANGHFICDIGRYAFHKYEDDPITAPQLRDGEQWSEISWEQAYQLVADKIGEHGGPEGVRALASGTLPNESNFLLGQLLQRLSEKKNIALIPVERGTEQVFPSGFRISADRGGNQRGVRDVVPNLAAGPRSLLRDVGVLLIMDADGRAKITSDMDKLLRAAAFKVVLASNASAVTDRADLVLPIAGPYEREGTVTNDQGLVQWLQPARQLQGEARADWLVVAELSRLLTGEGSLYTFTGDVTWKINHTIPAYSQATRFRLGLKGQFVGSGA